jgi:Tol biopolymer transport system component
MNLEGTTLGKYQLYTEIGGGGMGVVYHGYDPTLDRPVAVKVLRPHLTWEQEFVQRFLREARAAAGLAHPNIVIIHDVGEESGRYYFVMQYLEGRPLNKILQERGRIPPHTALHLLRQLASALDYAHGLGLVHRDVKPANVMVDRHGRVTLTDFGLVRAAQGTGLTVSGTVLGTPHYMSPEQASGRQQVGPASDLYGLAVVAYEMLCGDVPFDADSTPAVLYQQVHEPPPPIALKCPDLPPDVDKVLGRALAKAPGERYGSGAAFVEALTEALPSATRTGKESRPVLAVPWHWIVGAAVATVMIVLLALMVLAGGGEVGEGLLRSATPGPAKTGTAEVTREANLTNTPPTGTSTRIPPPTDTVVSEATDAPIPLPTDTIVAPPTDTSVPLPTDTAFPLPTDTPVPPPVITNTPVRPYDGLVGKIVFTRNPNGHQDSSHEIYVLDLNNGRLARLTDNNVPDWDPNWSPDGQSIVFVSFQADNYDIWVMDAAGDAQSSRIALPAWDDYPAWSPDGARFAFVSTGIADGGGYNSQVFVGSSTENARQITVSAGRDEWPTWSPDGLWLADSSDRDGDMDIFLFTANGSNVIQWTNSPFYEEQPAWSPDGQWIAFIRKAQDTNGNGRLDRRDDGEYGNLWIGRPDGSEFRQLTFDDQAADPAWSPDNRHIVFAHFWDSTGDGRVGSDDASDLWVIPATGGDPIVLLEGPEQDWAPDWTQ